MPLHVVRLGVVVLAAQLAAGCTGRAGYEVTRASPVGDPGPGPAGADGAAPSGDSVPPGDPAPILCPAVPSPATVAPHYPLAGADWNSYVAVTEPYGATSNADTQPDVACLGSEADHAACFHGGERRRVELTIDPPSCAGLSVRDLLDAFVWRCYGTAGGVRFVSQGFAPGKGLADLIDGAGGAWRANGVVIEREGCAGPVAASDPSAVWWSNPIQPLPANPGAGDPMRALDAAGTIYVAAADQTTSGYVVAAARVAVVTLGSAALGYSGRGVNDCTNQAGLAVGAGMTQAFVCVGDHPFAWLEVTTRATAPLPPEGLLLIGTPFARVHETELQKSGSRALSLADTRAVTVSRSRFRAASSHTVKLSGTTSGSLFYEVKANDGAINLLLTGAASRNHLVRMTTTNAYGNWGTQVLAGACPQQLADNVLVELSAGNNQYHGLSVDTATAACPIVAGLTVAHFTSANNAAGGAVFTGSGGISDVTLVNLLAYNNEDEPGLWIQQGNRYAVWDLTAYRNQGTGITVATGVDGVEVRGTLRASANEAGVQCSVSGGATNVELNGACQYGPALTLVGDTSFDAFDSLEGVVRADDQENDSDLLGVCDYTSIGDWFAFETFHRYWGDEGLAEGAVASDPFAHDGRRDECQAGDTCRIYDLRPRTSDTVLRHAFGVFPTDGSCPAEANATVAENVVTDRLSSPNTFLRHAIENILDGRGDDDGLCESDEECTFAPHAGSFQGDGPLARDCLVPAGNGVTGVRLFDRDP